MNNKPLGKIRVLDFTQNVCGPVCTQYLGDLGAEIIKVEPPEGDASRGKGVVYNNTSLSYIYTNRGKKSVKLDAAKPEHRAIMLKLAEKSDIFIEDFGPGKADALRLGYEQVKAVKPDIIYLSITTFGQTGPFRDYEGDDAILQAMSGYMSMTSMTYQGPFTKLTPPIADLLTGAYSAIGAITGLIHRKKTGDSLYVDVSKLSCMLQAVPDAYAKYLTYGDKPFPTGNAHRASAAFYPMPAKDGAIICNPDNRNPSERKWQSFCEEIGISADWYDSENFNTLKSRLDHRSEVEAMLNAHTVNFTIAEIEAICKKYKIAAGVMYDMKQLAEDPQTAHDKIVVNVHDSAAGDFKVLGSPLKYSAFEMRSDSFAAEIGEHTQSVLAELLNMTPEEITALA